MKRESVFFGLIFTVIFLPIVAMLILTGTAMAEEINPTSVTATKDATVYHFTVQPGTEFDYAVILPKQIPATGTPEETVIDFIVSDVLEKDFPLLLNDPNLDDFVSVKETNLVANDYTEVLFHIAIPHDLPDGTYQFWAVTAGFAPQVGTTILEFYIND